MPSTVAFHAIVRLLISFVVQKMVFFAQNSIYCVTSMLDEAMARYASKGSDGNVSGITVKNPDAAAMRKVEDNERKGKEEVV